MATAANPYRQRVGPVATVTPLPVGVIAGGAVGSPLARLAGSTEVGIVVEVIDPMAAPGPFVVFAAICCGVFRQNEGRNRDLGRRKVTGYRGDWRFDQQARPTRIDDLAVGGTVRIANSTVDEVQREGVTRSRGPDLGDR